MTKKGAISKSLLPNIISYGSRTAAELITVSAAATQFSVEGFGQTTLLLLLSRFCLSIFDFGQRTLVTNELSINSHLLNDAYIRERVSIKPVLLILVLFAVAIFHRQIIDHKLFEITSVICIVVSSYFNAISQVHLAIFHSAEKFSIEAKSSPTLAIGAIVNWFVMGIYPSQSLFFFLLLSASFVHVGGTTLLLRKNFASVSLVSLLPIFCLRTILSTFRRSCSYAFIIACDMIYSSFDTIAIANSYSLTELSLYEGFKRIVTVMTIPNVILSTWLTPRLVRLSVSDGLSSKVSLIRIWLLTCLVGIILSVAYVLFSEVIILFILDAKYLSITQFSWATVTTVLLYYARIVPGCYYVARGLHSFRVAVSLTAAAVGYSLISGFSGNPIGNQTVVYGYVSIVFTIVFNALFFLKNKQLLKTCVRCFRKDVF